MDRSEVEKKVKETIAKVLNVDAATVKPESNFVFDLGADSQQSIELIAAFEETFGVEMDEEAALGVQDVGAAVDFIHKLTS